MKCDIVFCGVGGQGGLSVATVIATAAIQSGLNVKQNEVHGMSQRGGAVVAMLRISDAPIASDLIPEGSARLILGMEPLESLRYLKYLSPEGALVTSATAVRNIPDYPDLGQLLSRIKALPRAEVVDAEKISRDLGLARAWNMVMVGVASRHLPLPAKAYEDAIAKVFERKGHDIIDANIKAFRAGV